MKKKLSRALSWLLTLSMVMSMVPASAITSNYDYSLTEDTQVLTTMGDEIMPEIGEEDFDVDQFIINNNAIANVEMAFDGSTVTGTVWLDDVSNVTGAKVNIWLICYDDVNGDGTSDADTVYGLMSNGDALGPAGTGVSDAYFTAAYRKDTQVIDKINGNSFSFDITMDDIDTKVAAGKDGQVQTEYNYSIAVQCAMGYGNVWDSPFELSDKAPAAVLEANPNMFVNIEAGGSETVVFTNVVKNSVATNITYEILDDGKWEIVYDEDNSTYDAWTSEMEYNETSINEIYAPYPAVSSGTYILRVTYFDGYETQTLDVPILMAGEGPYLYYYDDGAQPIESTTSSNPMTGTTTTYSVNNVEPAVITDPDDTTIASVMFFNTGSSAVTGMGFTEYMVEGNFNVVATTGFDENVGTSTMTIPASASSTAVDYAVLDFPAMFEVEYTGDPTDSHDGYIHLSYTRFIAGVGMFPSSTLYYVLSIPISYVAGETATVTYDANTPSDATNAVETNLPGDASVLVGAEYTISSAKLSSDNYVFLGWSTSASATSATTGKITISEDTTLYGVWAKQYTVTYVTNEPADTDAEAANMPSAGKTVATSSYTLSSTKPTLDGYNFVGWGTSATATADDAVTAVAVSDDISVYAIWELAGVNVTVQTKLNNNAADFGEITLEVPSTRAGDITGTEDSTTGGLYDFGTLAANTYNVYIGDDQYGTVTVGTTDVVHVLNFWTADVVTPLPDGAATATITSTGRELGVDGAGETNIYFDGDEVSVSQTPNDGYTFSSWSGATVANDGTFTIESETTVTPTYTAISNDATQPSVTGTITHNKYTGTVSGTISVDPGDYTFKEVVINGDVVDSSNYTYDADDGTLTFDEGYIKTNFTTDDTTTTVTVNFDMDDVSDFTPGTSDTATGTGSIAVTNPIPTTGDGIVRVKLDGVAYASYPHTITVNSQTAVYDADESTADYAAYTVTNLAPGTYNVNVNSDDSGVNIVITAGTTGTTTLEYFTFTATADENGSVNTDGTTADGIYLSGKRIDLASTPDAGYVVADPSFVYGKDAGENPLDGLEWDNVIGNSHYDLVGTTHVIFKFTEGTLTATGDEVTVQYGNTPGTATVTSNNTGAATTVETYALEADADTTAKNGITATINASTGVVTFAGYATAATGSSSWTVTVTSEVAGNDDYELTKTATVTVNFVKRDVTVSASANSVPPTVNANTADLITVGDPSNTKYYDTTVPGWVSSNLTAAQIAVALSGETAFTYSPATLESTANTTVTVGIASAGTHNGSSHQFGDVWNVTTDSVTFTDISSSRTVTINTYLNGTLSENVSIATGQLADTATTSVVTLSDGTNTYSATASTGGVNTFPAMKDGVEYTILVDDVATGKTITGTTTSANLYYYDVTYGDAPAGAQYDDDKPDDTYRVLAGGNGNSLTLPAISNDGNYTVSWTQDPSAGTFDSTDDWTISDSHTGTGAIVLTPTASTSGADIVITVQLDGAPQANVDVTFGSESPVKTDENGQVTFENQTGSFETTTSVDGAVGITTVSGNTTINYYTLTLVTAPTDINGTLKVGTTDLTSTTKVYLTGTETEVLSVSGVDTEDYTWVNWTITDSTVGTTSTIVDAGSQSTAAKVTVKATTTATANFNPNYGLTFDLNGGTDGDPEVETFNVAVGTGSSAGEVTEPVDGTNLSKAGFNLSGWAIKLNDDTFKIITVSTTVLGNVTVANGTDDFTDIVAGGTLTLYAVWEVESFDFADVTVEGTYGVEITDEVEYTDGDTYEYGLTATEAELADESVVITYDAIDTTKITSITKDGVTVTLATDGNGYEVSGKPQIVDDLTFEITKTLGDTTEDATLTVSVGKFQANLVADEVIPGDTYVGGEAAADVAEATDLKDGSDSITLPYWNGSSWETNEFTAESLENGGYLDHTTTETDNTLPTTPGDHDVTVSLKADVKPAGSTGSNFDDVWNITSDSVTVVVVASENFTVYTRLDDDLTTNPYTANSTNYTTVVVVGDTTVAAPTGSDAGTYVFEKVPTGTNYAVYVVESYDADTFTTTGLTAVATGTAAGTATVNYYNFAATTATGGTLDTTNNTAAGIYLATTPVTFNVTADSGYTFTGWSAPSGETATSYTSSNLSNTVNIGARMVIEAKFTAATVSGMSNDSDTATYGTPYSETFTFTATSSATGNDTITYTIDTNAANGLTFAIDADGVVTVEGKPTVGTGSTVVTVTATSESTNTTTATLTINYAKYQPTMAVETGDGPWYTGTATDTFTTVTSFSAPYWTGDESIGVDGWVDVTKDTYTGTYDYNPPILNDTATKTVTVTTVYGTAVGYKDGDNIVGTAQLTDVWLSANANDTVDVQASYDVTVTTRLNGSASDHDDIKADSTIVDTTTTYDIVLVDVDDNEYAGTWTSEGVYTFANVPAGTYTVEINGDDVSTGTSVGTFSVSENNKNKNVDYYSLMVVAGTAGATVTPTTTSNPYNHIYLKGESQAITASDKIEDNGVTTHIFSGWTNSTSGNTAGSVSAVTTADTTKPYEASVQLFAETTMTATYVAVYTVQYDLNNMDENINDDWTQADKVGTTSLVLNSPSGAQIPTGYTFAGWATTAGATSANVSGGTINSVLPTGANPGDVVTLYAIWTVESYDFDLNGKDHTTTSVYGTQEYTPATFEDDAYDAAYTYTILDGTSNVTTLTNDDGVTLTVVDGVYTVTGTADAPVGEYTFTVNKTLGETTVTSTITVTITPALITIAQIMGLETAMTSNTPSPFDLADHNDNSILSSYDADVEYNDDASVVVEEYTVTNVTWNWSDLTNNQFVVNTEYTATIELTAEDNHYFDVSEVADGDYNLVQADGTTVVDADGTTLTVTVTEVNTGEGNKITLSVTFEKTAFAAWVSVYLNGELDTTGATDVESVQLYDVAGNFIKMFNFAATDLNATEDVVDGIAKFLTIETSTSVNAAAPYYIGFTDSSNVVHLYEINGGIYGTSEQTSGMNTNGLATGRLDFYNFSTDVNNDTMGEVVANDTDGIYYEGTALTATAKSLDDGLYYFTHWAYADSDAADGYSGNYSSNAVISLEIATELNLVAVFEEATGQLTNRAINTVYGNIYEDDTKVVVNYGNDGGTYSVTSTNASIYGLTLTATNSGFELTGQPQVTTDYRTSSATTAVGTTGLEKVIFEVKKEGAVDSTATITVYVDLAQPTLVAEVRDGVSYVNGAKAEDVVTATFTAPFYDGTKWVENTLVEDFITFTNDDTKDAANFVFSDSFDYSPTTIDNSTPIVVTVDYTDIDTDIVHGNTQASTDWDPTLVWKPVTASVAVSPSPSGAVKISTYIDEVLKTLVELDDTTTDRPVVTLKNGSTTYDEVADSYTNGVTSFVNIPYATYDIYVGTDKVGTITVNGANNSADVDYYTFEATTTTGGNFDSITNTADGIYLAGTEVDFNVNVVDGYAFASWSPVKDEDTVYTTTTKENADYEIDQRMVIEATFTPVYNIAYDVDTNVASTAFANNAPATHVNVKLNSSATLASYPAAATDLEDGYTFLYWAVDVDGTTAHYANSTVTPAELIAELVALDNTFTIAAGGTITLYAIYEVAELTLKAEDIVLEDGSVGKAYDDDIKDYLDAWYEFDNGTEKELDNDDLKLEISEAEEKKLTDVGFVVEKDTDGNPTGQITGTPTTSGDYEITVTVVAPNGDKVDITVSIHVPYTLDPRENPVDQSGGIGYVVHVDEYDNNYNEENIIEITLDRSYTLVAIPEDGYIFTKWVIEDTGVTGSTTVLAGDTSYSNSQYSYSYTPQGSVVATAYFVDATAIALETLDVTTGGTAPDADDTSWNVDYNQSVNADWGYSANDVTFDVYTKNTSPADVLVAYDLVYEVTAETALGADNTGASNFNLTAGATVDQLNVEAVSDMHFTVGLNTGLPTGTYTITYTVTGYSVDGDTSSKSASTTYTLTVVVGEKPAADAIALQTMDTATPAGTWENHFVRNVTVDHDATNINFDVLTKNTSGVTADGFYVVADDTTIIGGTNVGNFTYTNEGVEGITLAGGANTTVADENYFNVALNETTPGTYSVTYKVAAKNEDGLWAETWYTLNVTISEPPAGAITLQTMDTEAENDDPARSWTNHFVREVTMTYGDAAATFDVLTKNSSAETAYDFTLALDGTTSQGANSGSFTLSDKGTDGLTSLAGGANTTNGTDNYSVTLNETAVGTYKVTYKVTAANEDGGTASTWYTLIVTIKPIVIDKVTIEIPTPEPGDKIPTWDDVEDELEVYDEDGDPVPPEAIDKSEITWEIYDPETDTYIPVPESETVFIPGTCYRPSITVTLNPGYVYDKVDGDYAMTNPGSVLDVSSNETVTDNSLTLNGSTVCLPALDIELNTRDTYATTDSNFVVDFTRTVSGLTTSSVTEAKVSFDVLTKNVGTEDLENLELEVLSQNGNFTLTHYAGNEASANDYYALADDVKVLDVIDLAVGQKTEVSDFSHYAVALNEDCWTKAGTYTVSFKVTGYYTDVDGTYGAAGEVYSTSTTYTLSIKITNPSSGGGIPVEECPHVVEYWLGSNGVTTDATIEGVDNNKTASKVPEVEGVNGYTFVGWSLTKDGTDLVDPTSIKVTKDMVFYAVYEQSIGFHEHYVIGYPNGSFGPADDITRGSVATIIARAVLEGFVEGSNYGNPAGYTDVVGNWAQSAIDFCSMAGVFVGYEDGSFRPNQPITRQEIALVLARLDGIKTNAGTPFSDIADAGSWAVDGIYTAYANGWINGYTDGTYKPLNNIRRDETVKIFNAYLGRGVDEAGLSDMIEFVIDGVATNNDVNGENEYMTWPDVPVGHWAYYEIIEAANDHEYYFTGEGNSLPEHWVKSWIDDKWRYHNDINDGGVIAVEYTTEGVSKV